MSNTYGVEIHGRTVKVNGEEIQNVESVHFSESADTAGRTVVELGGDFDFEGLSGVEFVFHPSSIREAVEAMKFYLQIDDSFRHGVICSIKQTLHEHRKTAMGDGVLAETIAEQMFYGVD